MVEINRDRINYRAVWWSCMTGTTRSPHQVVATTLPLVTTEDYR